MNASLHPRYRSWNDEPAESGYVGDEGERARIPHFPGDSTHVGWCKVCQQRQAPKPEPPEDDPSEPFIEFPEVFSWDVYQPAS